MSGPVPNLPQSIVVPINNINTVETIIEKMFVGAAVQAGDTYIIEGFGTCNSSGSNLSTFTIYLGTTGTTADTPVGTVVSTAGVTASVIGFYFRLMITFRTIGVSGSVMANGTIETTTITGGITNTVNAVSINSVAPTVATNQANYLGVSYQTTGATTSTSFQNVSMYKVK